MRIEIQNILLPILRLDVVNSVYVADLLMSGSTLGLCGQIFKGTFTESHVIKSKEKFRSHTSQNYAGSLVNQLAN